MAVKRVAPFVWVTWLSKVMAGEQSCIWASWFKTRYQDYTKVPTEFDQAQWKLQHTRLLTDFALELHRAGKQLFLETQNSFQYRRQSGLILAGRPDIVAIGSEGPTVYDMKTGKQRFSDQVQVMIYMYCLPRCMEGYEETSPSGCVVYKGHQVPIPPESINQEFSETLHHFLDILEADHPALKVPSAHECRFCEITKADCPERIDAPVSAEEEQAFKEFDESI